MAYPQQPQVAASLHRATNKALDAMLFKTQRQLANTWMQTRRQLQADIVSAYRASRAGSGKWSLPAYRGGGHEAHLRRDIANVLARFRLNTTLIIRPALKGLLRESQLRHAWVLDQVTPESRRVKVPVRTAREAASMVQVVSKTSWNDRWTHWVDAYSDALSRNLAMNAMNESTISDAVDEVDATTVNTPKSTLDNALSRIFNYEAQMMIMAGEDDVVGLNDDLISTEVWKTRDDANVCDDCDFNEGLTVDESDGDIPLHPNCNCFWLMVPKSYARLLRSGNEDDQDLARQLQARGIAPEALVIRGEDGKIAGKAVVDFSAWKAGQYGVLGEL